MSSVCCLLCIIMLTHVVSFVNSMPLPPSKMGSVQLSFKTLTEDNADNESFEYFNEEFVSPEKCEDMCSATYPTHTYPVVEHHLACKQGCILAQLGTGHSSCQIECSQLYNTQDEQYACGIGCTSPSLQTENSQTKIQRTVISISSVKISSLGLFNFKEKLKKWLWGNAYENKIHWDQKELYNLENGEELLVYKGHGYKSNPDDIVSLNSPIFQASQSSSQQTLVYFSSSMLHIFHHESLLDKVLLISGVLLLITAGLMSLASTLNNNSENRAEEKMYDLKEQTNTAYWINCENPEILPEKASYLQPVSVCIHKD